MEIAIVVGFIAFIAWLIHGATNNRLKDIEKELEDWSGVYDVKREVDNELSDPNARKRLRDEFNGDA